MNIYIMRHGEAEVMAKTDQARHLTAYGLKQAFAQGQWLKTHLKSTALLADLTHVIVSPYVRAQETFEQVKSAFAGELAAQVENWEGITPYGNVDTVVDYLSVLKNDGVKGVLLISHLPLVGDIVADLYGKRNPVSFYPATIAQLNWAGNAATIETSHYPEP